ncbi:hypothetical protein F7725_024853, partial [Dissostichus mawsoni]
MSIWFSLWTEVQVQVLQDLRLALDLLLSLGWAGPCVADLTIRSMISSASASSPPIGVSSTGGHAVSGGPVLQRELTEDFTEPVDADLPHTIGRVAEEQQEGLCSAAPSDTGSLAAGRNPPGGTDVESILKAQSWSLAESSLMEDRVRRNCSAEPRGRQDWPAGPPGSSASPPLWGSSPPSLRHIMCRPEADGGEPLYCYGSNRRCGFEAAAQEFKVFQFGGVHFHWIQFGPERISAPLVVPVLRVCGAHLITEKTLYE